MIKQKELDFCSNLIKGKIAEVVFEQMIREEKRYTVIPFGYEHTTPTLAQYREKLSDVQYILDNISDAPDFVLVSEALSQLFLVEVKYQSLLDVKKLRVYANKLEKRWLHSFIFVITPKGFFCERSALLLKRNAISPLHESWVSKERQEEYLKILSKFVNTTF